MAAAGAALARQACQALPCEKWLHMYQTACKQLQNSQPQHHLISKLQLAVLLRCVVLSGCSAEAILGELLLFLQGCAFGSCRDALAGQACLALPCENLLHIYGHCMQAMLTSK